LGCAPIKTSSKTDEITEDRDIVQKWLITDSVVFAENVDMKIPTILIIVITYSRGDIWQHKMPSIRNFSGRGREKTIGLPSPLRNYKPSSRFQRGNNRNRRNGCNKLSGTY
jgi:hypothetical protein